MPTAPRMNQPVSPYDFWGDTLLPFLQDKGRQWAETKPWPTPDQIQQAVESPGLLSQDAIGGYAVDMASPFAKVGGLFGVIKDLPVPAWQKMAWGKPSYPVGINPTKSEIKELLREERGGDLRALLPRSGGDAYMWPANAALHDDVGAHFGLKPSDYEIGLLPPDLFK